MKKHQYRLLNKTHPPNNITLAKGGVHVALVRGAVDFILHSPVTMALQNWLNDTWVPDETFFSSLNTNPHLGMPGSYTGELWNIIIVYA